MFNNKWYYFDEKETITKRLSSKRQLLELWNNGVITGTTKIFDSETNEWRVLQELEELFSLVPSNNEEEKKETKDPTINKLVEVDEPKPQSDMKPIQKHFLKPPILKRFFISLLVVLFLAIGVGSLSLYKIGARKEDVKTEQKAQNESNKKTKKTKKKNSTEKEIILVSKYSAAIFEKTDTDSKKVGTTARGETVTIYKTKTVKKALWGQLASGNWVCIKDATYEYLVDEDSYKQYESQLQEERKQQQEQTQREQEEK